MSTLADHGYIPEEHAPDPVVSHGDPTSPGKVAIWLFLASEIMFFIGILGSYIILRSGSSHLFAQHAAGLSKWLAGTNTLVLIFSSLTMALAVDAAQKGNHGRLKLMLLATIACAFGFMGIKYVEYSSKFHHYTVVAIEKNSAKTAWVYDGHWKDKEAKIFEGYRAPLPENFDINLASELSIKELAATGHGDGELHHEEFDLSKMTIGAARNYTPSRNIFYSCYYALTGVHGAHVVGGIIALSILLAQSLRGKVFPEAIEYTGLYWHFVDLVWIFLFPLLYLI